MLPCTASRSAGTAARGTPGGHSPRCSASTRSSSVTIIRSSEPETAHFQRNGSQGRHRRAEARDQHMSSYEFIDLVLRPPVELMRRTLGPRFRARRLARLRRLAVSPTFRKRQLVVLCDHPGAGRDPCQRWAPAFAGVDSKTNNGLRLRTRRMGEDGLAAIGYGRVLSARVFLRSSRRNVIPRIASFKDSRGPSLPVFPALGRHDHA